jgi:hypothetical protein
MAGMTRKERARKLHHDLDYILTHDKRGAAAVRRVIEGIADAIRTPQLGNSMFNYLTDQKWPWTQDDFRAYKTEAADRVRRPWLYPYAE